MKRLGWVFGVMLVAATAACGLLDRLGMGTPSRPFSHLRHVEEELECTACHAKAEKEAQAGMPSSLKQCMVCHEGIDEKRPAERKLAALLGGESPAWSNVTALPEEVKFSHAAHFEKKVACGECHRGIEESTGITDAVRVGMDACVKCHEEKGNSRGCSVCHTKIGRNTPPESHGKDWKRWHGDAVKAGIREGPADRCSLCHEESSCVKCHQDEPPRNHTNFWRFEGHAVAVGVDRSACATCHRSDFCDRCHQEVAPRNHVGTWGAPGDRHCLGCHVPAASQRSCLTCHRSATTHPTAPPRPANAQHAGVTEAQCRTCHTVIGLPHLDNGDACGSCH